MALEMRELKGDDLFTLLSIVGKLDIKEEFINMFEENIKAEETKPKPQDHKDKKPTKKELAEILRKKTEKEAAAQKRGMNMMANLMQKVLVNAGKLKTDINSLFSDLTGENIKKIQSLNLMEYTGLIMAFFKKEELKDFFTSIASLLQ